MTQATVPRAPGAVSCTADGPSTVLVTWQAPADGGAPINAYQLQKGDGEDGDFEPVYNGSDCQYQTTGLLSGLQYRFRVLAENEVGFCVHALGTFSFAVNNAYHILQQVLVAVKGISTLSLVVNGKSPVDMQHEARLAFVITRDWQAWCLAANHVVGGQSCCRCLVCIGQRQVYVRSKGHHCSGQIALERPDLPCTHLSYYSWHA